MKKLLALTITAFLSAELFSYTWPVTENVTNSSFSSYFAQLHGDAISSSIIFSNEQEVVTSADGKTVCVLNDYDDSSDFFPSTLGNAVIVSHKDNLISVYGNLEIESIADNFYENQDISELAPVAKTGKSGWSDKNSGLEFQICDLKNNTAINPRILMPRIEKELPLSLTGVIAKSRNGKYYKLSEQNVIPAGFYRIYSKRLPVATPYRVRLLVNGAEEDSIAFDLLTQDDGLLCITGTKNYSKTVVYPDKESILIGEVTFSPGKNVLLLNSHNILGKEIYSTYYLTNY